MSTDDSERLLPARIEPDPTSLENLFAGLSELPEAEKPQAFRRAISTFHRGLAEQVLALPETMPTEEKLAALRLAANAIDAQLAGNELKDISFYIGSTTDILDASMLGVLRTQIETEALKLLKQGEGAYGTRNVLKSLYDPSVNGDSTAKKSWITAQEIIGKRIGKIETSDQRMLAYAVLASASKAIVEHEKISAEGELKFIPQEALKGIDLIQLGIRDGGFSEEQREQLSAFQNRVRASLVIGVGELASARKLEVLINQGEAIFKPLKVDLDGAPLGLTAEEVIAVREKQIRNLGSLLKQTEENEKNAAYVATRKADLARHIDALEQDQ